MRGLCYSIGMAGLKGLFKGRITLYEAALLIRQYQVAAEGMAIISQIFRVNRIAALFPNIFLHRPNFVYRGDRK
jgi:hypothetical protein